MSSRIRHRHERINSIPQMSNPQRISRVARFLQWNNVDCIEDAGTYRGCYRHGRRHMSLLLEARVLGITPSRHPNVLAVGGGPSSLLHLPVPHCPVSMDCRPCRAEVKNVETKKQPAQVAQDGPSGVAQLLSCSVAQLLSCSVAQLLSCSVTQLLSCSVAQLPSCSVAQLLSCSAAQLLSYSVAQLPSCSVAQLLSCSVAQLLSYSVAQLLSCSVAQFLSCSVAQLLSCSAAQLLSCSVAQLLSCSVAQLLSCSVAQLLSCSAAQLLSCSGTVKACGATCCCCCCCSSTCGFVSSLKEPQLGQGCTSRIHFHGNVDTITHGSAKPIMQVLRAPSGLRCCYCCRVRSA
jgi:hypothetical protein